MGNAEKYGELMLVAVVLVGLTQLSAIMTFAQFGIIAGLVIFGMYLAVSSVIFVECVLLLDFILKRMLFFSAWRIIAIMAVFLFNMVVFVTALVVYVRPWAFA